MQLKDTDKKTPTAICQELYSLQIAVSIFSIHLI